MRVIRMGMILLIMAGTVTQTFSQYYDEDYESLRKKGEKNASEDGRKVLEMMATMALTNNEIIVGSCWDYIHAAYDRAGYSWGQREKIFITVKAGPYADISQIKNGDWIFFVNHSYGDIEHSALFVEWIDFKTMNALMYTYGGEKRREPAHLAPYELSNVFGITRPNSKLGATKVVAKTTSTSVAKPSGATTSTTNKVTGSSATASSTNSEAASKTPVSVSGGAINGMKIESLKFGSNINMMEVVGEGTSFPAATEKVFCWMRISGGQGKAVKVKWYYNGNVLGDVQLDVKSNSMRTYAFRTINGKKGEWKVEVMDPSGTMLHSAGFSIN